MFMLQDHLPSNSPSKQHMIVHALRTYPLLRSISYGLTVRVITMACSFVVNPSGSQSWSMSHSLAFNTVATPLILGLTYGYVRLLPDDRNWLKTILFTHPGRWLISGIVLGSTTYIVVIGIAASRGWVQFPAWG